MANFKYLISKNQKGFTFPEIVIITGIILMLFGFITLNVINAKHQTSVNAAVDTIVADIKNQQIKAMAGTKETGTDPQAYGIYFGSTSYTLFHGNTYSPSNPTNFMVNLDENIQFFNVEFPNQNLIFSPGSGEVSGFQDGQNTLIIRDITNSNQKTITVNRYGVITGVN